MLARRAVFGDAVDAAQHRDWDVGAALERAERALAVDAGSASGHMALAAARCAAARFDEAVASARRAARLDPASWLVRSDLGFFLLASGRDAEAEVRAALELAPDFAPARGFLAQALLAGGRERAALAALGVSDAEGDPGGALARHWRRQLEALPAGDPGAALARARVHARLGEADAAIAWLEESLRVREPVLVFLDAFTELRTLRRDPRFAELRRRVLSPVRG